MAVRTDVLLHGGFTMAAATPQTLITVPAGEVWLVRAIILLNRTGATSTVVFGAVRSSVTSRWAQAALANITPLQLNGLFYVAEAGDLIQLTATQAGSHDVAVYGARLVV